MNHFKNRYWTEGGFIISVYSRFVLFLNCIIVSLFSLCSVEAQQIQIAPPKVAKPVSKNLARDKNIKRHFDGGTDSQSTILNDIDKALGSEQPTSPKSIHNDADFKSGEEVLFWQYELQQGAYQLNKTEKNYQELLSTLEKLVEVRCMHDLFRTLSYDAPPENDQKCDLYIKQTLALDPENTSALCAMHGIDSQICVDYDLRTNVGTFQRGYENNDVSAELARKRKEAQMSEIKKEIYTLFSAVKGKKAQNYTQQELQDIQLEMLRSYGRLMDIECREEQIVRELPTPTPVPTKDPASTFADEVSEALTKPLGNTSRKKNPGDVVSGKNFNPFGTSETNEAFMVKTAQATPTTAPKVKVKKLTPVCKELVDFVLKSTPGYAKAICYKYGAYTPRCVRGLREEKRIKPEYLAPAKRKIVLKNPMIKKPKEEEFPRGTLGSSDQQQKKNSENSDSKGFDTF
jgi:hypothetical protein